MSQVVQTNKQLVNLELKRAVVQSSALTPDSLSDEQQAHACPPSSQRAARRWIQEQKNA